MMDRINGNFQLGDDLTGKRIVVAMSGGVDSSVVAALAAAHWCGNHWHNLTTL